MGSVIGYQEAHGPVATFETDVAGIIKSLAVDITPVQSGTGDPSPDNVRPITGWTGAKVNVNSNTIDITFPSEAGTVYGGTLDVVKGELVVDRRYKNLNDPSKWTSSTGTQDFAYTDDINDRMIYSSSFEGLVCSAFPIRLVSDGAYMRWTAVASKKVGIKNVTTAYTLTDIQQMAQDGKIAIVYTLATPITYQLTPQEISTIIGTNTIYADTGNTSVIYPKTITPIETVSNVNLMELRRNIIAAQAYGKTVDVTLNLGTHQVYPTDSIESLRKYLTVVSRGSETTVTDYTLRGNIDTVGNHQILIDCRPGIATIQVPVVANPSGILYEWDFTKSLTDERQNYTAILKTGEADEVPGKSAGTTPPVRLNTGVVFNNAQQVLRLLDSDIDSSSLLFGKTLEVDVAEFNYIYNGTIIETEPRRACFIMFGDPLATPNKGAMLYTRGIILNNEWIWRYWAMRRENEPWTSDNILLNGKNAISGHNIGLYINDNGLMNFYVDGAYTATTERALPSTDLYGLQIGAGGRPQYGGAFYNARITGVRIYDGNVYNS